MLHWVLANEIYNNGDGIGTLCKERVAGKMSFLVKYHTDAVQICKKGEYVRTCVLFQQITE